MPGRTQAPDDIFLLEEQLTADSGSRSDLQGERIVEDEREDTAPLLAGPLSFSKIGEATATLATTEHEWPAPEAIVLGQISSKHSTTAEIEHFSDVPQEALRNIKTEQQKLLLANEEREEVEEVDVELGLQQMEKEESVVVAADQETVWRRRFRTAYLHLGLLVVQVSFASLSVFGKKGLHYIDPWPFVCFRVWGSIPFLLVSVLLLDRHNFIQSIRPKIILKCGLFGLIFLTFNSALYVYGLAKSTANNAATIHLSIPIWTTVFALMFRGEPRGMLKFAGMGIALVGALTMLELEDFQVGGDVLVGNLMILVMSVIYSLYLVFAKPLLSEISPLCQTFWLFALSGVVMLFSLPFSWSKFAEMGYMPSEGWFSLLLAVVIGTFLPYVVMQRALNYASPVITAVYLPVELLATVLLSIIVLGEDPTLRQGAGACGILLGLVLVTYAKSKEEEKKEDGYRHPGSSTKQQEEEDADPLESEDGKEMEGDMPPTR
ncbi:hypothetical protein QOT17_023138 [Balamuthia mandrillaris]